MAESIAKPRAMGLQHLYKNGKFSDYVITCGERKWEVHKAIICPQSEYFMSVCDGGFSEAKAGHLDLSCDDADALESPLSYLYTGEYPEATSLLSDDPPLRPRKVAISDLELHEKPEHVLKVHLLADKYGVDSLTMVTADLFERLVSKHMFDGPEFSSWLIAVLEDTSPTSVLRESMFDLVLHKIELFFIARSTPDEGVDAFRAALVRCPEFAAELLSHTAGEYADMRTEADTPPVVHRVRQAKSDRAVKGGAITATTSNC
ncbi:hypothetical protein LTR95_016860 [Oleoguttula sp. CCFEE 5521]